MQLSKIIRDINFKDNDFCPLSQTELRNRPRNQHFDYSVSEFRTQVSA